MNCVERRRRVEMHSDDLPPITFVSTKPTKRPMVQSMSDENVFWVTVSNSQRLLMKVDDSLITQENDALPPITMAIPQKVPQSPPPHQQKEKPIQIVQQERPAYHTLMKLKLPKSLAEKNAAKRKEVLFALRELQLAAIGK
ncbi:hypothetical protein EIN_065970 [Entamoeba invadens IP1]|uniref:Uncharacterized protein n=1 Tax=Entamoeba invadens IP1 TaxID=370355 RepID=A0A0A1TVC4_ENTIV|nr:hypothetical protein EIN_065970 [Entamoeba invadens IP1]ELP84312.1 hypothetical protein EIN_065970 [Entamoeba invadens IP1]|eukprot:XP_004183658.1 hypothetical protein EIN_065970 [Entamoeba invadens IP1]